MGNFNKEMEIERDKWKQMEIQYERIKFLIVHKPGYANQKKILRRGKN